MRKELLVRLADIWQAVLVLRRDPRAEMISRELEALENSLSYLIIEVDREKEF